jgi:hypothetical protein
VIRPFCHGPAGGSFYLVAARQTAETFFFMATILLPYVTQLGVVGLSALGFFP